MVKMSNPPKHVALIPDGNRRWARANGLKVLLGHSAGVKKFIDFATWSKEFGVKTVTVWALSTENLTNRPSYELKALFNLYTKAARDRKIINQLIENKARLRIVGDISKLPLKLRQALTDLERTTGKYRELTINMLINYGGREDLIYSVQKIANEARRSKRARINAEYVKEHLRTAALPDVDLILRTSGEMRLSGLLPWQATYSELYFAKKYWPDFSKEDFRKAISTFSRRQRRFGK